MTESPRIRYRPDGSIDTDHYMQLGRGLRSERAMNLLSGGAHRDGRTHRRAPGRFRLV